MMKLISLNFSSLLTLLLLTLCLLTFLTTSGANQITNLDKLLKSRKSDKPPNGDVWPGYLEDNTKYSAPVYVGPQEGLMEADKIDELPGQPQGVDFDQYGGYVTIDPKTGKTLFYYFVESPQNSSTKPLVLWLNGGPGCSSLGYGAMEELGPFRVNSDRKTLFRNDYAWNNAANVIFLESPAGVGFSYSNSSSDYEKTGDKQTAKDSYTFLVNWLDRFPQYKGRDFFITGESYAGHYAPQLAYAVLLHNNNNATNHTIINLKGIAIGNAWIDDDTNTLGMYDYFWSHALNSDETNAAINKYCDFAGGNSTNDNKCGEALDQSNYERGVLDIYNIYAPLCHDSSPKAGATGSVEDFDPCSDYYVETYLNRAEVQAALHAKTTQWSACSGKGYYDSPTTILTTIKQLINSGMSVWIYSGDTDGRVPVTSSRYSINSYKLPIETAWRPWYTNNEVGGYVVAYKGVTFATVRGAGHLVPSYQPARALTMISSFLQGKLPPPS